MKQCSSYTACRNTDFLSGLPLAMSYVPWQSFKNTYDPCKALHLGTIFPELCQPFCGKRGVCK